MPLRKHKITLDTVSQLTIDPTSCTTPLKRRCTYSHYQEAPFEMAKIQTSIGVVLSRAKAM